MRAAQASDALLQREIEARERAEREIRELRRFVEQAADAHPHILYLFELAPGRLLYINRQLTRLLGYTPEQALAAGLEFVTRVLHPGDLPLVQNMVTRFAAIEQDGMVDVEIRVRSAAGEWRWIHSRNIVLLRTADGLPQHILGTAEDVTERKRSEESLVLLRRAIERANDGISVCDMEGRSVYQNDAFTNAYGYRPDELDAAGGPLALFDKPEIGEEILSRIHRTGTWSGEVDLRSASGNVQPTLLRAAFVTDDAGGPIGIALVCTDVSERRRMDERARAHEAELAHVLRLSTVGEMATGLAHELNQPLSGIVSYARGCARRLEAGTVDAGAVADVLARISAEALRAGEIIRRLRALVRKEKPRREAIDLNRTVRGVARLVAPEARRRRMRLHLRLQAPLPVVHADRIQIEQVLLNLIRNGFEAMAEVGVDQRLLTIETSVDDAGQVTVAVTDLGPGIAAETAERVFEPFFTTKGEGLGMGLAISRTIVEAHDGRLSFAAADVGAKFWFQLPAKEREGTRV
jgi:two-component system, LuxR family, sensor kinase FixL